MNTNFFLFLFLAFIFSFGPGPVYSQKKSGNDKKKGGREVTLSGSGKIIKDAHPEGDYWVESLSFVDGKNITYNTIITKTNPNDKNDHSRAEYKFDCFGRVSWMFVSVKNGPGHTEYEVSFKYASDESTRPLVSWGLKKIFGPGGKEEKVLKRRENDGPVDNYMVDRPEYWQEISSDMIGPLPPRSDLPCDPSRGFYANAVYLGPSFHRESVEGEGLNFAGVAIGANHLFESRRIAIGAEVSAYARGMGDLSYLKIFALGGVEGYPFESATQEYKIAFSLYALAGLVSFTQKYSSNGFSSKNTSSGLAYVGGAEVCYNLSNRTGVSLRTDYGRTQLFNDGQNSFRFMTCLMKRFGQDKNRIRTRIL